MRRKMKISNFKLWEGALAIAGIIFLIVGSMWIRSGELPEQQTVIDAGGSRHNFKSAHH